MAQKSTLRIRFRLNQQTGQKTTRREAQREGRSFAQIIASQVGLEYAERMYEDLKQTVSKGISADVRNEIQHIARQYKRFIIGSNANQRSARGVLTSSTVNSSSNPAASQGLKSFNIGGTRWAPRKKSYLQAKQRIVGHTRWFEYAGLTGSAMMNGSTWTRMFGPVEVKVIRALSRKGRAESSEKVFARGYSPDTYSVARIEVTALGKITPAMLPALLNNDPAAPIPRDGRTTGLISLVSAYNKSLGDRIGGGPNVPYRPTLEPFLAFALTRSIPAAVTAKINNGLNSRNQSRVYKAT